jgi:hypothetical protein
MPVMGADDTLAGTMCSCCRLPAAACTALGHRDAIRAHYAVFRAHVTGGIRWALGLEN